MGAAVRDPEAVGRVEGLLGGGLFERVFASVEAACGLPNAAYWSEDWLRLEQERLFGRNWVFACAEAEVPKPGDVKPVEVAGVPIFVVRGKDREVRAFQNVCRHRGAQLVQDPCNRTVLTCPYHAWTYGLDGKLRSRPHFHGAGRSDSFADGGGPHRDLLAVRAETIFGCVFVNLSGAAEPLAEAFAELSRRLSGYDLSALSWAGKIDFALAANWKLIYENYIENYHVFSVHPRLSKFVPMALRSAGGWCANTFENGYDFPRPEAGRGAGLPHFPGLSAKESARGSWFMVLPNFAVEVYPDQFTVIVGTPQSPDRTREELHVFLVGEEAATGEAYAAGRAATFRMWDELNKEDLGVLELMQQGRRCPGYDGGRLSPHWEGPTLQLCQKLLDAIVAP